MSQRLAASPGPSTRRWLSAGGWWGCAHPAGVLGWVQEPPRFTQLRISMRVIGNSSPRGSGALPNLAEGGKEALGEGWQRCQHHVLNAACAGGTKSNRPAAVLLRPSQALCALQDLGAELSTPARPHKTSTNWGCLPELLLLKDDFEELSSLSLFIKPKQAGVPALLLSRDPASTRGAHQRHAGTS